MSFCQHPVSRQYNENILKLKFKTFKKNNNYKFAYSVIKLNKNIMNFFYCYSMSKVTNIHKTTWVSLDHFRLNQTDNIRINDKFGTSLIAVRIMRREEVAQNHFFVVGELRYKSKQEA